MSAPKIQFSIHQNNSVVKLTTDQDLKLEFVCDQANLELDVWTDWETGKFHSLNPNQVDRDKYELLLPSNQTGFFYIKIRYRDPKTHKFVNSDAKLEIHIDPDWIYDSIVYNIFLRTYGAKGKANPLPGEGGTFEDVIKHMDDLQELGINVIYLNPFHVIGDLYRKYNPNNHLPYYLQPGSPYSIKDYKSIDPEVAFSASDKDKLLTDPKKQFQKLVQAAHRRGMRIFMDLVFNHTAHDFILQRIYPEWYLYKQNTDSADDPYIYPEEVENGEPWGDPKHTVVPYDYGSFGWTDTAQLNWDFMLPPAPNNPPPNTKKRQMYAYFKSIPQYWVSEFGVDGFRCDIAYKIPDDFWKACINEARQVAKKSFPKNGAIDGEIIFIGETRQDRLKQLFEAGFSFLYGDYANKIFKPLTLKGYLDYMYNLKPKDSFPQNSKWFIFPECHDFDRNSSKLIPEYSQTDADPDLSKQEEMAVRANASRWVLTACLPGMPMVFNGFEKVEWSQVDHISYSRINWQSNHDIFGIIKKVNQIRHQHLSLQKGKYQFVPCNQKLEEDTQIMAFYRYFDHELILVVINMDIENKCQTTLDLPKLAMFNPDHKFILKDLITNKIYERTSANLFVDLAPGESHIFLVEQQWGE